MGILKVQNSTAAYLVNSASGVAQIGKTALNSIKSGAEQQLPGNAMSLVESGKDASLYGNAGDIIKIGAQRSLGSLVDIIS